MPKLPAVKPKKVIKILEKSGFQLMRIKGSHYIFYRKDRGIISVPYHNKELKPGTLTDILKKADISIDQFLDIP